MKIKTIILAIVIATAAVSLLFGSVYMLSSGEEAVITRLGEYRGTVTTTGLNFKFPFIERKYIVNVENIQRLEFGYRSTPDGSYINMPSESSMLTGDENLVIADWAILYRVKNSYNYLFKVNNPINALRIIAESSYRRIVASHPLDDILTDQKDAIQHEIMQDLQIVADKYELGIMISAVQLQDAMPPDEVNAAFLDVASAREQRSAKINEASKYENEQLPMARGEAAKLINEAEAYKAKRINEAEGMVARYAAVEAEYAKQPRIMHTRLYLEMLNEVLPRLKGIYFVDENSNTLQFLPLNGSGLEVPQ